MRIYYRLFFVYSSLVSANHSGHVTGRVKFREKPQRIKAGSRPEVDDQWYNLNQIKTFEDNGIDTSHFHVAYPYLADHLGRTRAVRARDGVNSSRGVFEENIIFFLSLLLQNQSLNSP